MHPSESHELWQEFHVSPRYLAGSTYTGDTALQPLFDQGWEVRDDELGNVYVTAPDFTVRVGFLPEGEDNDLWKITAYRDPFGGPHWAATFGAQTPTEVVEGFTTALAAAHARGDQSHLYDHSMKLEDALKPLVEAGWKHEFSQGVTRFTTPDTFASVAHTRVPIYKDDWLTMQGGPPDFYSFWDATYTRETPKTLIAGATKALADPSPVIRSAGGIPRTMWPHLTATLIEPPAHESPRSQAARARSSNPAPKIAEPLQTAPAQSTAPAPPSPRRRP
ncbi:DUF317 domain-containing protein [Streptomyces carpaticus]|uniref:DUF317 domain-containing protein n=1 Tax=Streptomyces carpaticus TaxID=285558 RepID=A0ABV4ZHG4_9ACTN